VKKIKKNEPDNIWGNNLFIIKMVIKACPARLVYDFINQLCRYGGPVLWNVVLLGYVTKGLINEWELYRIMILMGILFFLYLFIAFYFNIYDSRLRPLTDQEITYKITKKVLDKANDVELGCYEDADFFDKYTRGTKEAKFRAIKALDNWLSFIVLIIACLFLSIIVFEIDPYAILIVLIPLLPNYYINKQKNKLLYQIDNDNTFSSRQKDFVMRTVYLRDYAEEIRITNIFNVLKKNYYDASENIINSIKKKIPLLSTLNTLDGLFVAFIVIGPLAYATFRMLYGTAIGIDNFVLLIGTIISLSAQMSTISLCVSNITDDGIYSKNLKEFLTYQPLISESFVNLSVKKDWDYLELKNVNFSYVPNKDVLRNISLKIKKGEKIAIVGHNGAGKTTLIKLLLRFYDPTAGEIHFNKENIKDYTLNDYRNLYSTVFQDYNIFSLSIAENILLRKVTDNDLEKCNDIMEQIGLSNIVNSKKDGIKQLLTREFDDNGAILSGGQYQKLVIGRAIAKDTEIVLLDEPSSALDPVAEAHMFDLIMKICENKTVIFISHKLSSVTIADRIYLLDNGRIAEAGTHAELMEDSGLYAKMFLQQAKQYIGEESN